MTSLLSPSPTILSFPSLQQPRTLRPIFVSRNPSSQTRPPPSTDFREPDLPPSKRSRDTKKKTHRKPHPSFYDQTLHRWSVKVPSRRSKLPWQEEDEEEDSGGGDDPGNAQEMGLQSRLGMIIERLNDGYPSDASVHSSISAGERTGAGVQLGTHVIAPWVHGGERKDGYQGSVVETRKQLERVDLDGEDGNVASCLDGDRRNACLDRNQSSSRLQVSPVSKHEARSNSRKQLERVDLDGEDGNAASCLDGDRRNACLDRNQSSSSLRASTESIHEVRSNSFRKGVAIPVVSKYCDAPESDLIESKRKSLECGGEKQSGLNNAEYNAESGISDVSLIVEKLQSSFDEDIPDLNVGISSQGFNSEHESGSERDVTELVGTLFSPWEREGGDSEGECLHRRTNTELAERNIPELELQRLRNVSLRMKERIKVGAGGVTDAIVQTIHEKWKQDEVVKLKFEGPSSLNMKRTHEILESKTGGMVIWRSGSSLVLYRGMSYELPCVQSYTKLAIAGSRFNHIQLSNDSTISIVRGRMNGLTGDSNRLDTKMVASFPNPTEVSSDISDINSFLDQLGPRFKDWSGRDPLPIDADLLPGVVQGYSTPFRLLPYKTRSCLSNKEMTYFRRLARTIAPHFALGRNRQHQGLANAMVKLWDKSAIAKIAIKRGVLNTCNERMAEEIKKLTGGTIVSRNKEYIVFYRGNDFVTPSIREALEENQKLAAIKQDEEEIARLNASPVIVSKAITAKVPLVAGTLAETMEAKNRWGNQLSSMDRENMKRDIDLAKHASIVRYLGRQLSIARAKVRKAEKALSKVQEYLQPANLPTDLEIVTDEERFLFRRMGLKMNAFLLLGRRGVFDGTIQNMHLNWKHRELVKIIVKGKNFAQVKQIAISLEAESGGVMISLDKTTKGYAIVMYRGKNYQRPAMLRPSNLLTRRQALERSIELQRREALNRHISNLWERIQMMRSQLNQLEANKARGNKGLDLEFDEASIAVDDVEDEGVEAYLETYNSGDEDDGASIED